MWIKRMEILEVKETLTMKGDLWGIGMSEEYRLTQLFLFIKADDRR